MKNLKFREFLRFAKDVTVAAAAILSAVAVAVYRIFRNPKGD